jgi:hypothetical protein
MFSLTARRAPRSCGRLWKPNACGATLSSLTPGWQIPLSTSIAAVRYTSDVPLTTPVRVVRHGQSPRPQNRKRAPNILTYVAPEPKTEAWYEFFLTQITLDGREGRVKPRLPYDLQRISNLSPNLPEALQHNPLKIFDVEHTSQVDAHLVRQSLEQYIINVSTTEGSTNAEDIRECYMRDTPGAKALFWSTSLSESKRREVWDDSSFIRPTIHCLVAERNMDTLWYWLSLEDDFGPKDILHDSIIWKQTVLWSMIQAQIHWTEDEDYLADAITTLIKAWDMNGASKSIHIPLRTPTIYLLKMMIKIPTCNVVLYDRFATIVRTLFTREGGESEWLVAQMLLRHPQQPGTSESLKLLRSNGAFVQHWLSPETYQAGLSVLFTTCTLAQRCKAEGRESDAKWVLNRPRAISVLGRCSPSCIQDQSSRCCAKKIRARAI